MANTVNYPPDLAAGNPVVGGMAATEQVAFGDSSIVELNLADNQATDHIVIKHSFAADKTFVVNYGVKKHWHSIRSANRPDGA